MDVSGTADEEVDILVVGSGAGALTAAIVAADNHAQVLVIEKADQFGGTSATSGGVLWIPASHLALAAGVQDSAAEGEQYISALAQEDAEPERIRAFVEYGPEMLEYLEHQTEVRYASIPYTDYHAELPGGKMGWRSHDPLPVDGRRLGADLYRLRRTHPSGALFGRISWKAAEAAALITRGPGWQRALATTIWRYLRDVGQRVHSNRSRFLTSGNALLGGLKLSLDQRGVSLRYRTSLVSLIMHAGRVDGAVIAGAEGERRIRVRKAIILAAGGFERDQAMRSQYLHGSPNPDWSGSQEGNTGDAIRAAQAVGADVRRMDAAWWAPTIRVPSEDRARPLFYERSLPGAIMVDPQGHRFINEAASYHKVGQALAASGMQRVWVIFDREFRWRYPMGPLMPMIPDALHSRSVNALMRKAPTIAQLASQIGIDPAALQSTVERFNLYAARGEDPDFGRGQQAYDRYYGDPKVKPNPNLRPLSKAPFYALPVHPGDIGTSGGLATDAQARVLDKQGLPIAGLYAIGNSAASVMGRAYPGAGSTIGPAMTFGYIAARDATGVNRGPANLEPRSNVNLDN
jgi:3-oxosteroid 1-dehydrogenase